MRRFILIVILINSFVLATLLYSQSTYTTIQTLSQNTNTYLFQSSGHQIFVSSTEGLNIFDGLSTEVYRPATHKMFGLILQSKFFEDNAGLVWFTTYEALNYYDPRTDDL
ncbi:MAG TPA: hypothetical protein PLV75_02135, partial [Saprospiraceae bacterium]|nr:hypothetical protein [Saprospiraceae bacterium]